MTPSWYDLLGVDRDASTAEIRRAWKAGIADLDPTDRRFQLLNKAAGVLLDDDSRAAYDEELDPGDDIEGADPDDDTEDVEAAAVAPSGGSVIKEVGRRRPELTKPRSEKSDAEKAAAASRLAGLVVPGWVLVVLLVAVLVVAGGAYALQRTTTSPDEVESNMSAARAAAEKAVPRVLTYDYRYPERDHDRAMDVLSGGVADHYDKIWDDAILPNLEKVKGEATTQALGSGVVRASEDGDKVEVVVVITTTTRNKNVTTQVPPLPMTVQMVEKDGEWKIAKMDLWEPDAATGDDSGASPSTSASPEQQQGKKKDRKQRRN